MRILHIIQYLASNYGGPASVVKDICKGLVSSSEGHEVTIYTTNLDYPKGYLEVETNCPLEQDGYTIWYFHAELQFYGFSSQLFKKLLSSIKNFDMVEIHGIYRFPQTVAAYIARFHRVPYIICPHGALDPFLYAQKRNYWLKRLYEKNVDFPNLNHASAIHYTAEQEYELTKPLKLKAPHFVIPWGLHLEDYTACSKAGSFKERYGLDEKRIILYLGRLNFKKGLDILIDAFGRLCKDHSDTVLIIAGPDNEGYSTQLRSWIAERDLQTQVVFTGLLLGQAKLDAFQDADVFVLPSYTENFGITIIEAMACGLPVVISDKVNIWREIQRAGAGLVTACDASEVFHAIAQILDDPAKAVEMGIQGKELAHNYYNWSVIAPSLLQKYQALSSGVVR